MKSPDDCADQRTVSHNPDKSARADCVAFPDAGYGCCGGCPACDICE